MQTKAIIAFVAAVFLVLAALRIAKDRGRIGPASRTWLIVAVIFGAVSLWLWTRGYG